MSIFGIVICEYTDLFYMEEDVLLVCRVGMQKFLIFDILYFKYSFYK